MHLTYTGHCVSGPGQEACARCGNGVPGALLCSQAASRHFPQGTLSARHPFDAGASRPTEIYPYPYRAHGVEEEGATEGTRSPATIATLPAAGVARLAVGTRSKA